MSSQTYTVVGMTCDHCVSAVGAEVGALPGVTDVAVDLATGQVTVRADEPVSDQQVRGAVEEAGYTLTS
jgi:copper chaperone